MRQSVDTERGQAAGDGDAANSRDTDRMDAAHVRPGLTGAADAVGRGLPIANVMLLQRTAGNAAVTELLQRREASRSTPTKQVPATAEPSPPLGRRLIQRFAGVPGMLGKGRAGKTYKELRERLASYFEEHGAEEKYGHIVAMQTLIDKWKKAHVTDKSARGTKHRQRVDLLQQAITAERPTAMTHSEYVKRMREGAFRFLSGEAKPEVPAVHGLIGGQTKALSTEQGLDEKALRRLRKHGLTEAEVLAIKVYTVGDYALINPTVEGGTEGAKRLRENLPWVGGMLPANLRPGDEPDAAASAATKQAYQTKKATWDAAVAQLLAGANWNRLDVEAREHAVVLTQALLKLPPESRSAYRGMRLTLQEFQAWKTEKTIVTWPAFFSASKDPAKGEHYASKQKKDTLGVLLICDLKRARDVTKLSVHRSEGELMLLPGARLYVKSVRPVFGKGWHREIEVTEV